MLRPESPQHRKRCILLHFLNIDFLRYYGWLNNRYGVDSDSEAHLRRCFRLAVALSSEYALLPPTFILQTLPCLKIMEEHANVVDLGFVRLPLREVSVDEFLAKKEREYRMVHEQYGRMFGRLAARSWRLLERFKSAMLPRNVRVGEHLARVWAQGPEAEASWLAVLPIEVSAVRIDACRMVGRDALENGFAITPEQLMKDARVHQILRRQDVYGLVLKSYNSMYCSEFRAQMFSDVGSHDQLLADSPYPYWKYRDFERVLAAFGMREFVLECSPEAYSQLLLSPFFRSFVEWYESAYSNRSASCPVYDSIVSSLPTNARLVQVLRKFKGQLSLGQNPRSERNVLVAIDEFLGEQIWLTIPEQDNRGRFRMPVTSGHVCVFVALTEELEALLRPFGNPKPYRGNRYQVERNGVTVSFICPGKMGRVAAALETAIFLGDCKRDKITVDLIVVAGVAGGFQKNSVELGDVLIPEEVFDISQRKVISSGDVAEFEFRPTTFRLNDSLKIYLTTPGSFPKEQWAVEARQEAAWPWESGRVPTMRGGPLACADEVVAYADWATRIFKVHPKMIGVDMETGGVCAAAEKFGVPVVGLRCVSDMADEKKGATSFREISKRVLSHLLGALDFSRILSILRES